MEATLCTAGPVTAAGDDKTRSRCGPVRPGPAGTGEGGGWDLLGEGKMGREGRDVDGEEGESKGRLGVRGGEEDLLGERKEGGNGWEDG